MCKKPVSEVLRNICGHLNCDTLFEGQFGRTCQHFKYVYSLILEFHIYINLSINTYTNIYLNVCDRFVFYNEMSENKWPSMYYTEKNKLHLYVLTRTTIQVSNSKTMQSISFMTNINSYYMWCVCVHA